MARERSLWKERVGRCDASSCRRKRRRFLKPPALRVNVKDRDCYKEYEREKKY